MAVEMGEGVDWVDKSWYQVDEVLGRVVVERKVDAHEELPDEANWYSKATMTNAKLASGVKMPQGTKTPEAAKIGEDAATWVRQRREQGKLQKKIRKNHHQTGIQCPPMKVVRYSHYGNKVGQPRGALNGFQIFTNWVHN